MLTAEHRTLSSVVWQLTKREDGGLRTEPLLDIAQSVRDGAVSFSGDGARLAVGSGDMIQVADIAVTRPLSDRHINVT